VEECFLGTISLISLSLSLRRLRIVVRVIVVRSMSHTTWHLRVVLMSNRVGKVAIITIVIAMGAVWIKLSESAMGRDAISGVAIRAIGSGSIWSSNRMAIVSRVTS
jgi:hypothetical protein